MAEFTLPPVGSVCASLHGHSSRCFDVRVSQSARHALTCSEDGTAKLWDLSTNRQLFSFAHSSTDEVLRCGILNEPATAICTAGANGQAIIWAYNSDVNTYDNVCTLSHSDQIYTCEVLQNGILMTAADDEVHLWDLHAEHKISKGYKFESTLKQCDISDTFGGIRNPDKKAYVFDAKPSPIQEVSFSFFDVPRESV